MKQRIYIDTSVLGGCFDEEFANWSEKLINEFRKGIKIIVISDITLRELEKAPLEVKSVLDTIPKDFVEHVILEDEARILAFSYIKEGVTSEKFLIDAQHIAIATIEKVDVVVSWNFKHIVNLNKIHLYNGVNLKRGYSVLEVRSPREVLYEEEI